jgi:hypothetical protein
MRSERGNAVVEFTLVGIPLVFILISIFEISRGMWVYHTIAHAVKNANRFLIVKGENCIASGNSCGVTIGRIAQEIRDSGVGLDPAQLNVTLISLGDIRTCNPIQTCLANTTPWPTLTTPAAAGSGRGQNITIQANIPFRSAIALFWPGAARTRFGVFNLGAASTEKIQF